jgi:GT2 family glycosyltransferase
MCPLVEFTRKSMAEPLAPTATAVSRILVSIIVPSFNQGRFIRQTLESVLRQEYRPLEIIVVDGGSSDETLDVLRSFDSCPELRWISEPDSGVVEAVNKGLAMAQGSFAAIQSSDDYYLPGAIRTAVEALEENPELSFVFGDILKVDVNGEELSRTQLKAFTLADVLAMRNWIPQPSTFFRLDRARAAGGWREEVPYAADTDLWLRMAFHGSARKLDALLAARRQHPDQRDQQGQRIIRDYDRMIDKLQPLRSAPVRLRRAAKAGQLMLRNRYDTTSGASVARRRLLQAASLYPPLLQDLHPLALIPGGWSLRRHAATLWRRLRHSMGVVVFDLPRLAPQLLTPGQWWKVCNREDICNLAPDGHGLSVGGRWSKTIHACYVFPPVGKLLMRRALQEWPIELRDQPLETGSPRISVVIPHRGRAREEQLRLCLASFLAQRSVAVECIVVEQSPVAELGPLPPGVRHVHLAHPTDPEPWRKSWAYNVGVRAASCDLVLCHDGDILVPRDYAAELCRRFQDPSLEVLHPQRFLFYLDQATSQHIQVNSRLRACIPHSVSQNWCGGTLAIRRSAFDAIGGFDERFVDWGGEDDEFYDRCRLLRQVTYGYLPFVHLWHPAQISKFGRARQASEAFLQSVLQVPTAARVENLLKY